MQHHSNIKLAGLVLISNLLTACDSYEQPLIEVDFLDTFTENELKNHQATRPGKAQTIKFGFALRGSAHEDARRYAPFLNYLEKVTGYDFQLQILSNTEQTIAAFGNGKLQMAALGASEYLQAREKYPVEILVRGLNQANTAEYHSSLVVNTRSTINSITQLKHTRFAFGSKNSTQGHLIPRIELLHNDIRLTDLKSYTYTGSHYNCANAVIADQADVCGMQDTLAHDMARQGLLKVIHESRAFPSSGIVILKNLDPQLKETIKKALLAFDPTGKHQAGLYQWDSTEMPNGFTSASDDDYREMYRAMKQFGMFNQQPLVTP